MGNDPGNPETGGVSRFVRPIHYRDIGRESTGFEGDAYTTCPIFKWGALFFLTFRLTPGTIPGITYPYLGNTGNYEKTAPNPDPILIEGD